MVEQRFDFVREPQWPALGWLAECVDSHPVVKVRHGTQVEVSPDWFCEAVWDGDFQAGDFDRTDLVFGSGARRRGNRIAFVSSASTVDRLQFLQREGRTWVSNSLACLLAAGGVEPDITYPQYPDLFKSIVEGIDSYQRRVPTDSGRLEMCYWRNLVWDGRTLCEEDKPFPDRDFSSFNAYRAFLARSFAGIAANMADVRRQHRYGMVAGLSSGYDSTTVTVLAHEVGLNRVFSFRAGRGGVPDHGAEVARRLDLELVLVDRRGWQARPFAEVPYFAATGVGVDVNLSAAADLLRGHVFVSGFHGDKIWAKDTQSVGPDIVRGDSSGLSLTEHRLMLGCIHWPAPFMGVRQIGDVRNLSNSAELARWDVAGDYSRPICRRIAETAGIPRDQFGTVKKASTNLFRQGEASLTEATRGAYHQWLSDVSPKWRAAGKQPPTLPSRLDVALWRRSAEIEYLVGHVCRYLPSGAAGRLARRAHLMRLDLNRTINVLPFLFPWASLKTSGLYRGNSVPDRL